MSGIAETVKQATISNIIKRVKAGKVPTSREEKIINEWEASKASVANPFDIDNTGLASFFGVTSKTVCAWAKEGMPKESHGLYNLKKCFDWWCDNVEATREDNNPKLIELRAEGQRIKNEREKLKLDAERGVLISIDEVVDQWCKRIAAVRQSLLAMPVRLSPVLEGKEQQEIRAIIKDESYRILEDYSRAGKYCEKSKNKRRGK